MTMFAALSLLTLTTPALSFGEPPRRDGIAAWQAQRQGRILPIRDIERRVIPTMAGAQYLGFDFDLSRAVYTLKFLRDGAVIWVEVDGRSGQIVGRSGR